VAKKKLTFEQAITRLEEIVDILESGTPSLEESVALYKEGMTLADFCGQKITTAESEVVLLQKNISGEIEETHFEPEEMEQ